MIETTTTKSVGQDFINLKVFGFLKRVFHAKWAEFKIKGLDDVTENESCFRGGASYCIFMNDYKE